MRYNNIKAGRERLAFPLEYFIFNDRNLGGLS